MRRVFAASLLALCACAAGPAIAGAGTYKMYSCEPPGVNIANPTAGPWRVYSENSPGTQNLGTCGQVNGGAMQIAFNGDSMPANSRAGWELAATALNPSVGIVRVRSWVNTYLDSGPQACPACFQIVFPENLGPSASALPRGADTAEGFTSATNDPPAALHRLGLFCGNGGAGAPCTVVVRPNLVIHGTETDLVEHVAPTGSVDGGSLGSPGTKAGPQSLSYSAGDAASGIQRVEVLLGGTVAGAADFSRNLALPIAQQGSGNCTYTGLAACPPSQSGDIAVDTTKVPNGAHPVTLRAIDAAGNRKDVAGPQVLIANATTGAPNGTPPTREARLTAQFARRKARTRRVAFKTRPLIGGRLVTGTGQPIAGARIVVLARPARAGARAEQIDVVTSSAAGAFSYRLPGGPSRRVTFSYTAFAGDPKASATSSLRTLVSARLTANPSPRSPRVGRRFRISGRLQLLPRAGVQLTIQFKSRGVWRTVGSVKTRARGRFTWRYRFVAAAGRRTFSMRVHIDSPIYPFAAGNSRVLRIRVR